MTLSLVSEETEKNCGNSKCPYVNPQPFSSFGKNRAQKDGYTHYCRACQRAAGRDWDKKNRLRRNLGKRLRHARLKKNDPYKAWAQRRDQRLREQYGITLADYNQMFRDQNGRCAICERTAEEFPKKLVVDHDHVTGKVRKLLCGLCNQLLGSAKENIKTLTTAIKYLEEHSGY